MFLQFFVGFGCFSLVTWKFQSQESTFFVHIFLHSFSAVFLIFAAVFFLQFLSQFLQLPLKKKTSYTCH